jgi:predicted glycosyltransferase
MYRTVFVPDYEEPNLTGILSHGLRYVPREKVQYIGILSHLHKRDVAEDVDYFISLSGPEPQRRVLEKRVLAQAPQLQGRVVIAGGKPDTPVERRNGHIEYYGYLDPSRQEDMMNRAKFIISRSGYTTVMELVELDKTRVLMLPTPGQTEQEYLADYYEQLRYFHHVSQYKLNLRRDIEASLHESRFKAPWKTGESVARFQEVLYSP